MRRARVVRVVVRFIPLLGIVVRSVGRPNGRQPARLAASLPKQEAPGRGRTTEAPVTVSGWRCQTARRQHIRTYGRSFFVLG